jgi:hypothetical protein
MRFFTKKEDAFLKRNYKKVPAKRMAKMLGRSESTARQRMKLLGLVVPTEIIEKFKRDSQIKPGNVPQNKGKRMPKEVYEKVKGTMFKKGDTPINHKEVGSKRVSKDGYLEIKTREPNKWEHYHRLMWEETFGKIPKGMIVRFVTPDKLNVHPFNLELIDRRQHMLKNSYHRFGTEIAKAIQLRGALTRQINKHIKNLK